MVFIKPFFILSLFLLSLLSFSTSAQNLYVQKLKTKQAIENIRFIEQEGRFTYFQNRLGELYLARNFSNKIVLKDIPSTYYNLTSSKDRKRILVSKNSTFYSFLSTYKNLDLFAIDYGTINTQKLGRGLEPKLHLNDSWVSYYDIEKKELRFFDFKVSKEVYTIPIKAPDLSMHIPQVVAISETQIIYTDLNENYQSQLIAYYPQTRQTDLLYQSEQKTSKIDLCLLKEKVFFSQVSKTDQAYAQISMIDPANSPTLKKITTLYNRASKDLGHMVCHEDFLYFFKQRKDQENLHIPDQDLFSINITTKKIEQRTSNIAIENLFLLDSRLMTTLAGEFYKLSPKESKSSGVKKKNSFLGESN